MNARAFRALLLREVLRGERWMVALVGVAVLGGALAAMASPALAMAAGFFALTVGLAAPFGPILDMRRDKARGVFEFDRVLPVSHRTIATARLLGAAVRTLPVLALCAPILIATLRYPDETDLPGVLIIASAVAGWLLLTAFMWAIMAVNIRWNLRRLWWVPMTIAFGPRLLIITLPAGAKRALADQVAALGTWLAQFATSAHGIVLLTLLVLVVPAVFFAAAVSLFASGLERYTHQTAISEVLRTPPPARELGAIGRGPMLAVSRYGVRLATERWRRTALLLVVFAALLLFGSGEIRNYAQFYVRALAALLPGAIALQLTGARTLGHLEGMQQLPHPASTIAAGHLIAIALLAVPGAAVWVLARAMTGLPPTAANVCSLFSWLVAGSWSVCVGVMWFTPRRVLRIIAVPVVSVAVWIAYAGAPTVLAAIGAAIDGVRSLRTHTGPALPLAIALLVMVGGLPLFARGLEEYQPSEALKQRGEKWRLRRAR